jgi:hypothetical protein
VPWTVIRDGTPAAVFVYVIQIFGGGGGGGGTQKPVVAQVEPGLQQARLQRTRGGMQDDGSGGGRTCAC